jgi:hypothetical protein
MDRDFILESIGDLRGEDLANSLAEHAKDVSWVESEDRNIPQFGGGPARGIYQYEIKGTKDGSGASETALNRFYNYISKNNLSIPLEYEDELKNLSDKNNPDFTELSPELQSQIFYADKALGTIPLDKLADGSLSSRDAWVKYHQAGSEKERPDKEEQFDRAMRTRPATLDAQTDQMLSGEQPGSTFRPEDDTVPSDTGTVTGDQAEKEPGFLDTVGEYAGEAYDTVSEYAGETVNTLEGVAESVGDKLRRLLGLEEEQQSSSSNDTPPLPTPRPGRTDTPPLPTPRPGRTDTPPLPTPRPSQTKTPSFNVADAAEALYSSATTGSRASARKLRDMVAQQLGVYESSQEATSEAKKYGLNEREVDTLRHILGAGLLKYIGKDSTQPLLQGTELFEKISTYAQRLLDPDSKDKYRKSYYDQSIEEANIDIVNYQVGAALAKQFDKKDDFINYAVELVKELGKGKTPVVVDKMPTRFGLVDRKLTPRLSTGVIYPPEELKRRNLTYNPDRGTLTAPPPPPVEDYGFVEPAPGSNLEDQGPAVLEKAEGGSVEKEVEFVKEDDDDDDVPDPPPGATPEEVADDIPAYLSTGEYVLPANVVRYIGLKNITGMHQRALSELQQMEDLDIIENVDENGYVEEDDDEMDYMKPEGVVEIVVAEHHPKGLLAMGFAEGGMINSDSSMEEGQVLPTSDIFSEGVYAQANIDRSVDSEDVVESDKVITAPIAFSSAPGKTAYLAYITPEEATSLRQAKQGFSSEGNGLEVSDGQYQHLGPKGLMSFNGQGGGDPIGGSGGGDPTSGPGRGQSDPSNPANTAVGSGGGDPTSGPGRGPTDPSLGSKAGFDRALEKVVKAFTRVSLLEEAEKEFAKANQAARAAGVSVTDGRGYSGPAGSPPGPAFGGGDEGNDAGGSQEFSEEEKADTDTEKSTDTDPLSDYIYVPGVGYRRKIRSVKPLSELKAGGYVTRNGIMAKGYDKGGDVGDGHGGGMSEFVEDLEPEEVEEEKPTDPYEGYTYVKGIGYVPTSRRATSNKPIESASLALSSIFTPGFLRTIGIMSDPNE